MKFLFLILISTLSYSQTVRIIGNVYGSDKSIENASVVINDENGLILNFTFTNQNGDFEIKFSPKNYNFISLNISCLGYKKKEIIIHLNDDKEIIKKIELEEISEELTELILKSDQKISVNNDTITIKTKYFTNDTEQTVEDVLKKIPGIEIDKDGNIKANGKNIKKLLVEGDDLFDNNYKILSKNLDGKLLESIQILSNFNDNPILKELSKSEAVAINLLLKKEKLNIWFGSINLGIGVVSENRWEEGINIGLIKKKIKLLYLAEFNNSGTKIDNQLSKSYNFNDFFNEERFEKTTRNTFKIESKENNTFSNSQSIFNNSLFNTLAFNTKLAPKVKLRNVTYFGFDNQFQKNFSLEEYNIEPNSFFITESKEYTIKNIKLSSEIELKYDINKRNYFNSIVSLKSNPKKINDEILFNSNAISTNSNNENYSFYSHFNHTYKVNNYVVLNNYLYLGNDLIKEKNKINSPYLNTFFNNNMDAYLDQINSNELLYLGLKSKLITKYKKIQHILSGNIESNIESNNSKLFYENTLIENYSNDIFLKQRFFNLQNGLEYEPFENFKVNSFIEIGLTKFDLNKKNKDFTLVNITNSLIYKFQNYGTLSISYNINNSLPNISLLAKNYRLITYRTFEIGLQDNLTILKSNSLSFTHNYFNIKNRFSTKTSITYQKTKENNSLISQIDNDFIFNNNIIINGGNSLIVNFNIINYLKKLKLATKFETNQMFINSFININSNELSLLKSQFSTYKFSGTTYFENKINFEFEIVQNNNVSYFNNLKNKNSITKNKIKGIYNFSNVLTFDIENETYWLDKMYSFLNSTVSYNPVNSKFYYSLTGNNLLNLREFKITSLNQYVKTTNSIPLIERYILLNVKYRF